MTGAAATVHTAATPELLFGRPPRIEREQGAASPGVTDLEHAVFGPG